jgi:hypothetical protein
MYIRHRSYDRTDLDYVEVDQASGMLSVQLGASCHVARKRLIAYAGRTHREVIDVALDVINRQVTIGPTAIDDGP